MYWSCASFCERIVLFVDRDRNNQTVKKERDRVLVRNGAGGSGGVGARMRVEIFDSQAFVLRPQELRLQEARGDAHICGLLSLDLGLKQRSACLCFRLCSCLPLCLCACLPSVVLPTDSADKENLLLPVVCECLRTAARVCSSA